MIEMDTLESIQKESNDMRWATGVFFIITFSIGIYNVFLPSLEAIGILVLLGLWTVLTFIKMIYWHLKECILENKK